VAELKVKKLVGQFGGNRGRTLGNRAPRKPRQGKKPPLRSKKRNIGTVTKKVKVI